MPRSLYFCPTAKMLANCMDFSLFNIIYSLAFSSLILLVLSHWWVVSSGGGGSVLKIDFLAAAI